MKKEKKLGSLLGKTLLYKPVTVRTQVRHDLNGSTVFVTLKLGREQLQIVVGHFAAFRALRLIGILGHLAMITDGGRAFKPYADSAVCLLG